MERKLAKITSARLEIQDRHILSFWIFVDYEEMGCQGVGGMALDSYCEDRKGRVGTTYGCEMIRRLLMLLGVNELSEAKGKMVWVLGEGPGFSFKPLGLETLRVDSKKGETKSLVFEDVYKEFADAKED